MARMFTDFADYPSGVQLHEAGIPQWAQAAYSGNISGSNRFLVQDTTSDYEGDRRLQIYRNNTSAINMYVSYQDFDSYDHGEILVKILPSFFSFRLVVAGVMADLSSGTVRHGAPSTGIGDTLGTVAIDAEYKYWMRFRVEPNGEAHYRIWREDVAEPSAWNFTWDASAVQSVTRTGFGLRTGTGTQSHYVDVLGIGTNGDSAPDSAAALIGMVLMEGWDDIVGAGTGGSTTLAAQRTDSHSAATIYDPSVLGIPHVPGASGGALRLGQGFPRWGTGWPSSLMKGALGAWHYIEFSSHPLSHRLFTLRNGTDVVAYLKRSNTNATLWEWVVGGGGSYSTLPAFAHNTSVNTWIAISVEWDFEASPRWIKTYIGNRLVQEVTFAQTLLPLNYCLFTPDLSLSSVQAYWWDHFYVKSVPERIPGKVLVHGRKPNADGSPNQMSRTHPALARWEHMDQVDSHYLTGDSPLTQMFSHAAIPTTDDVVAVQTYIRAREEFAGVLNLRHRLQAGASNVESTEVTLPPGFANSLRMWPIPPQGGAWTPQKVNDLEVGVRVL